MEYSVKQVSEKLGISVYTLHYYDKEGLLPFIKKKDNGTRVFTEGDVEWVDMILALREIDMPIAKIKEYISLLVQGEATLSQRRTLITQYREYLEYRMQAMKKCLDITSRKLNEYDKGVLDILDEQEGIREEREPNI
ncbi:MerR family transcriptional regulator [uncultured Robinsoniella sp.]|uniref:MerR family transcriptional regulator n=1 Tax=uncultured Robinsoniella sp. TaxID=904190 RepID=UPI00374E6CD1